MKRLFSLASAAALSITFVVPAHAYFTGEADYWTKRATMQRARIENRLPNYIPVEARTRGTAEGEDTGRRFLRRAEGRRFRRLNRSPKTGADRYRVLNTRRNKRGLRRSFRSSSLDLPVLLVQTGGHGTRVDRPSRRSIRGDRNL